MTLKRSTLLLVLAALLVLAINGPFGADAAWGSGSSSSAVAKGNKDQQIILLENDISQLRQKEMRAALTKMHQAQAALEMARRKEGFFYTSAKDKAIIKQIDGEFQKALMEVNQVREIEDRMLAKLKPLYGLVSTQFVHEQSQAISQSLSTVSKMSYDNAWYASLFEIGDVESLTDLIVGFLAKWFFGYVMMYPFAVLYYALWVAPRSVLSYCSGVTDIVPAIILYGVSVGVMCLPLVVLAGGAYVLWRRYGEQIQASLNQARTRERFHRD